MPVWRKNKNITQLYKFFRHKKNKLSPNYVDKKKFINIGRDFFLLLQDHLIDGKVYYPPHGMGEFRINKYKFRTNMRVRNYHLEREHFKTYGKWKKFFIQNFHTGQYIFRIMWIKRGYTRIPARTVYEFDKNRVTFAPKLKNFLMTTGDAERFIHTKKNTRISNTKTLI